MRGILKWPLVIAAIVVVVRVILERSGATPRVSGLFSVVALYLLICPLYFAFRIGGSDIPRPYRALLKTVALYAALARAMVIPTYWLAYIYQWPEPRFSTSQGGVVGPNVTPFLGYIAIPFVAAIAWIIGSVIIGGGLGSIVVAIRRRAKSL